MEICTRYLHERGTHYLKFLLCFDEINENHICGINVSLIENI